jgi:hypothetical protein
MKRDLARAISDVCGVQAQVLTAAELAVRARVEGITQHDVRDELWRSHTVVKTWCMRGTLHLLATADLPLYVAALKDKLDEVNAWLLRAERVTAEEVDAISAAIDKALSKGSMTREELTREVGKKTRLKPRTKKTLMSAWGVLLRPAAYQGHLAFGENMGQRVTFVNPSVWVTRWREPPARKALLELFRRYLAAYGPAALKDFGHWWGNVTGEERSVLGSIPGELAQVEIGRAGGFMLKRDAEEAAGLEPARGVHLLPSFDPYVMMYSPRELLISAAHRNRIFSQEAGWVFPSVVIDGIAAGTWSMKKLKGRVEVDVEPFRALAQREKAGIDAEASDIGRFLGTTATVAYKNVG